MDWLELREAAKALLLPPASPILLITAGVLLTLRRPRAGRALAGIGLVAAWLSATWALADAMFGALESGQRPLDAQTLRAALDGPDPPRAVVVVAAGARRDGLFEPRAERLVTRSLERAVAAARLAKQAGLPVLIHGWSDPGMDATSAELMRRVIEDDGGATVRWLDVSGGVGHAGIGQAIARTLAADGVASVIASTHAHNMPRLRPGLEAAGLKVLPAPHTFRSADTSGPRRWLPNGDAAEANAIAFYEWFGLLSYRLPGRALAADGAASTGRPRAP